MPSLDALQAFYQERQRNPVHCLTEQQDTGPEELNLSEFVDADLLQENCEACKLKRVERRQARSHKAQTYRRA